MNRLDELKYIFSLFDKLDLNYVLIRPLYKKELNDIKDIDLILSTEDYQNLVNYLNINNILFSCYETYTLNKVMLKINNFKVVIDINLNKNCFTSFKIITLENDLLKYDTEDFNGIQIRILQEPYLFINWTLHHILDKKSFKIGSVHTEYINRYQDTYQEYLTRKEVSKKIELLFLDEAKNIQNLLLEKMYVSSEILDNKTIKYINKKVFSKKVFLYHNLLRIKFGLQWRINKYVFRKYRPIKSCFR